MKNDTEGERKWRWENQEEEQHSLGEERAETVLQHDEYKVSLGHLGIVHLSIGPVPEARARNSVMSPRESPDCGPSQTP